MERFRSWDSGRTCRGRVLNAPNEYGFARSRRFILTFTWKYTGVILSASSSCDVVCFILFNSNLNRSTAVCRRQYVRGSGMGLAEFYRCLANFFIEYCYRRLNCQMPSFIGDLWSFDQPLCCIQWRIQEGPPRPRSLMAGRKNFFNLFPY